VLPVLLGPTPVELDGTEVDPVELLVNDVAVLAVETVLVFDPVDAVVVADDWVPVAVAVAEEAVVGEVDADALELELGFLAGALKQAPRRAAGTRVPRRMEERMVALV
jgi:hypothetical protein